MPARVPSNFVAVAAVLVLLIGGVSVGGCQSVPPGPGIALTVRAEPKQGYVPPDDPDQGYGGTDSEPAQPAGHIFHRIDYHRLDGILVWVEPLDDAARSSAAGVGPMNAVVSIDSVKPARAEDFQVASVGGRIVVNGDASKGRKGYVMRTESGTVSEVPPGEPGYAATTPGLVEVLSDDADAPLATAYVVPPLSWSRKTTHGQQVVFTLAPGSYRVSTWHPILPGSSQVVQVAPGQQMTSVNLSVGVNSLPKAK